MKTILFVLALIILCSAAHAEGDFLQAPQADLQWWRDARFGMFIHWGPVSIKGTEISWSRAGNHPPFAVAQGGIPVEEYDALYKQFNPTKFNAREWVAAAQAAGMKYIVFTTKHHDGFCEFDSALTDYKITNSPFARDVTRELADACHRAGIRLGFYYSAPDWHHPDFWNDNHSRYIDYFRGQVRELCSNYGKVSIIWFDCGGPPERYDAQEVFEMIRTLQPGVLINNRLGLPADFDTPEQTIGAFQNKRPWESCITICNQWSYRPDDPMKSLSECIRTLVSCAGGDGNLLFNVGPMPTGEIEPRQVQRLREMGDWLRRYGKSVYSTRGGPYKPAAWGCSTYRGDTVYLHVFQWSGETLSLPGIARNVLSARALSGGQVKVSQNAAKLRITLPSKRQDPIDTVIELKLDGPASSIGPISPPSPSLASGRSVQASNTYQKMTDYGPDKAVDDDASTRWATDSGTSRVWLEVDLGRLRTFDCAIIDEAIARVQKFELQYLAGGEWQTFYEGTTVGPRFKVSFGPVTARRVRLNILEATDGPTIYEFQLINSP